MATSNVLIQSVAKPANMLTNIYT